MKSDMEKGISACGNIKRKSPPKKGFIMISTKLNHVLLINFNS